MVWSISDLSVSTIGAALDTVTLCSTLPGLSVTLITGAAFA